MYSFHIIIITVLYRHLTQLRHNYKTIFAVKICTNKSNTGGKLGETMKTK